MPVKVTSHAELHRRVQQTCQVRSDLGAVCEAVGLKAGDHFLRGGVEAGEDPSAGQRQLRGGWQLRRGPEIVAEALKREFDGVPELVAPVAVGHHALYVQVHAQRLRG